MTTEPNPGIDLERTSLRLALSELLSQDTLETVFQFFASSHMISMDDNYPLTRKEIENALEQYFRSGASVIMLEYDKKFYELTARKDSIA